METNEQSEDKYLKELSPSLFDDKIGFEPAPPEGYFDEFGAKLNTKILEEEEEETTPAKPKTRILALINYKNMAIAASIAAIIAIIPFLRESSITDFPQDDLYNNLLALDLDEEDLSDYLDMDLIYDSVADEEWGDVNWSDDLTEDEIVTFLLEEQISEDLIISTIQLK